MITYIAIALVFLMLMILGYMLGSISLVIPVWFVVVPLLGWVGASFTLIWYYMENEKWNPEGGVFKEARKKDVPLLKLNHLNGFFKFVVGKKDKKGDVIFKYDKDHHEGIRIDPSIQSSHVPVSRTIKNLTVYEMATNSPWALSTKNALAYKTILDYVRKNYPQLDFFSDLTLLEFIKKDRAYLTHDCRNLVQLQDIRLQIPDNLIDEFKKEISIEVEEDAQKSGEVLTDAELHERVSEQYEQRRGELYVTYGSNYLAKLFTQIQDEASNLPLQTNSLHGGKVIEGVFFSFAEAFRNVTSAWTAGDVQTVFQYFDVIAQKKNEIDMKWMAAVGLTVMFVLVGAGLAAYIAGLGNK